MQIYPSAAHRGLKPAVWGARGGGVPASRLFKKATHLNVQVEGGRHRHNWRSNTERRRRKKKKKTPALFAVVCHRLQKVFPFRSWRAGVAAFVAHLRLATCNKPVLVSGLENSCCRSLFSEVLRTTTMSAGRVSRFFSRNPFTLYMTLGKKKDSRTECNLRRSREIRSHLIRLIVLAANDETNQFQI